MGIGSQPFRKGCLDLNDGWLLDGWLSQDAVEQKSRLDDVIATFSNIPMGRTDCAQPMLYAINHKMKIDAFQIYTDNETWSGDIHPIQALRDYRRQYGNAKLIVVATSTNDFSIADPADKGMMDVVGFDTAIPQIMADFIKN